MRFATVLIVAAAFLDGTHAAAQTSVSFVPSMSIGGVYDDNVFARVEGSAGQMLQVRPSLEVSVESPRTTMLGLYSFDMIRSNHADLTTLDARRHALLDVGVRTTPMTRIAVVGRYDRTETPGEINIESGVLSDRQQAERFQFTPSFTRRLSPLVTIAGSYDWTSEYLVDSGRGTMHSARASASRDVSARSSVTMAYVGRFFAEAGDEQVSHALLGGWSRRFSPATNVTLQAGPRVATYRGVAPEVAATIARTTPRLTVGLDYWHGEAIVLGIHGPVGVNSATARAMWRLTRKTDVTLRAGASDITTIDERDARVYRGTLTTSWAPSGTVAIVGSYGVDYQIGDVRRALLGNQHLMRHMVSISMTVAPRLTHSILPPDEAARAKGVLR